MFQVQIFLISRSEWNDCLVSNAWGKVSSDESDEETVKKIEALYFDGKSGKQVCVCVCAAN